MARPPKTNTTINGKPYYRLRKTIDGKVKNFYGKSKGDAENKYRDYVEKKAQDAITRSCMRFTATLGERADEFIDNALKVSQKYANSTVYRYERSYLTYIKDNPITKMVASDVKPSDIQVFYNDLDVTMQTIKGINKFMSAFCKWMVLNGYSEDFMSAVEIPKKPENKRHEGIVVWEEEEVEKIIEHIQGHRLCFFVYVLLYTGMRISEAIALRYDDIEDDTIHVVRQYYMKEMKPPKYGSSRDIPMHEELKKALQLHSEWHKREMTKNHYRSKYVFTTSNGNLYDPTNIRTALRRFYAKWDIPYKHPHTYRSTFCTQLCRCGVPLEVASALMGHKSIEVTASHYALVKRDTKEDAIAMLHY